jgi:HK97 family phage prohead protease
MCAMKVHYFQCETKSVTRLPDGKTVRIKGFASTPQLDRHDDIVLPAAFIKTLADHKARGSAPALLRQHNPDYPCGTILMDGEDAPAVSDAGLAVTADITDEATAADAVAGEMQSFSIGYIPLRADFQMHPTGRFEAETGQELFTEARILKELDLVEVSIVSTPANPSALFTVKKSLAKMFSSFLPHSMKIKCDVCAKDGATGRVGARFFCKDCISKMQFKSEEVTEIKEDGEAAAPAEKPAEAEKPAPAPAEAAPEKPAEPVKPETDGEKPSAEAKPEEGEGEKGAHGTEGKVVVSKEDKEKIIEARKKFEELDAATVAEGTKDAPAAKSAAPAETVQVEVDMKQLPSILERVASVLTKMSERIEALEGAERARPIFKGKSIMAFQHGSLVQVKEDGKTPEKKPDAKTQKKGNDAFVAMLQSAKQAPVTLTVGDADDDDGDDE